MGQAFHWSPITSNNSGNDDDNGEKLGQDDTVAPGGTGDAGTGVYSQAGPRPIGGGLAQISGDHVPKPSSAIVLPTPKPLFPGFFATVWTDDPNTIDAILTMREVQNQKMSGYSV